MIHLIKAYCLDENILFPNCNQCGNELTPFLIQEIELNKLSWETHEKLLTSQLLYKHFFQENEHLIFLCKFCLKDKLERTTND